MMSKLCLLRRILVLVFVLTCLISLYGCKDREDAAGGRGDVEYLTMWNSKEPQAEFLKQMASSFEDETGIHIQIDYVGRNVLTKVKSRFMMGDPPDLVDQDFNEIGAAISSGNLEAVDLNKVMEGVADIFDKELPELYADGERMYFFPYESITSGFFYDKNLYKRYGLSVPETWDQFIRNNEMLRSDNINPLAADGSINFYNAYYYCWAVQRVLGTGALKLAAEDRDGSAWEAPGYLEAAEMIYDMSGAGKHYFQEGYKSSEWPNAQIEWAKGNSGSLLCSTWIPSETKLHTKQDFSYGFFSFPEVKGGIGKNTEVEVAYIGCAIPGGAKNISGAVSFLKYISKRENAQKFSEMTGTISARKDVNYPEELEDVKIYREKISRPYKSYDGVWMDMPEWWTNVFLPLNDKLFFGELAPKDFIEKIKKESAAFWSAR